MRIYNYDQLIRVIIQLAEEGLAHLNGLIDTKPMEALTSSRTLAT